MINKIDLPAAEPERIREQIEEVIGIDASDAILVQRQAGHRDSRNSGSHRQAGAAAAGDADAPLRALIFDSWFDPYRGVIMLARIIDGKLQMGQKIKLWSNGQQFDVEGLGYQSPKAIPSQELSAGEVGYITPTSRTWRTRKIGDTITDAAQSGCGAAARLRRDQAHGVRGAVSGGIARARAAARCARKTAAERQRA